MAVELSESWIRQYFDGLLARAASARPLAQRSVSFADGTLPRKNDCHNNAERFARENAGFEVVRGWLASIFDGQSGLFDAHSVLTDPFGALFDITPMPPEGAPGFLRHEGTGEEFEALRVPFAQVPWPQRPYEWMGPEPALIAELEAADLAAAGLPAANWGAPWTGQ